MKFPSTAGPTGIPTAKPRGSLATHAATTGFVTNRGARVVRGDEYRCLSGWSSSLLVALLIRFRTLITAFVMKGTSGNDHR